MFSFCELLYAFELTTTFSDVYASMCEFVSTSLDGSVKGGAEIRMD